MTPNHVFQRPVLALRARPAVERRRWVDIVLRSRIALERGHRHQQ